MADEQPRIIYDELNIEEIERDHANLSLIRMRLERGVQMMTNDMASSLAGREVIKTVQLIELELTRMQASLRRLKVPDEG